MISGMIGKKIGMTHLFQEGARVVPVTVVELGPCVVTQVRTKERDGYEAIQLGYGEAKQLNQPARGHLAASSSNVKHLREFQADDVSEHPVGQRLTVAHFQEGDLVDVMGTTKGRGFQGVMKRHGFHGGKRTHGQGDRDRAPGSIGAGTYPGRVVKGKRMPGHMGTRRVTTLKISVVKVDPVRNLVMLHGAVPGARNGLVTVSYAKGASIAERVVVEEIEVAEEIVVQEPEAVATEEPVAAVPSEEAAAEEPAPKAEAPEAEPETEAETPEAAEDTGETEAPAAETEESGEQDEEKRGEGS